MISDAHVAYIRILILNVCVLARLLRSGNCAVGRTRDLPCGAHMATAIVSAVLALLVLFVIFVIAFAEYFHIM